MNGEPISWKALSKRTSRASLFTLQTPRAKSYATFLHVPKQSPCDGSIDHGALLIHLLQQSLVEMSSSGQLILQVLTDRRQADQERAECGHGIRELGDRLIMFSAPKNGCMRT